MDVAQDAAGISALDPGSGPAVFRQRAGEESTKLRQGQFIDPGLDVTLTAPRMHWAQIQGRLHSFEPDLGGDGMVNAIPSGHFKACLETGAGTRVAIAAQLLGQESEFAAANAISLGPLALGTDGQGFPEIRQAEVGQRQAQFALQGQKALRWRR